MATGSQGFGGSIRARRGGDGELCLDLGGGSWKELVRRGELGGGDVLGGSSTSFPLHKVRPHQLQSGVERRQQSKRAAPGSIGGLDISLS